MYNLAVCYINMGNKKDCMQAMGQSHALRSHQKQKKQWKSIADEKSDREATGNAFIMAMTLLVGYFKAFV